MDDEFFEDLEESINKPQTDVEPIAFKEWKDRGYNGFHSRDKKYSDCRHTKKTLDDESRMVRCDECEAYLDPFDCLHYLVSRRERNQNQHNALAKQANELQDKIFLAKKELKSLNGKIKRRKGKIVK